MKVGSEDKKKLIAAGALGLLALGVVVYNVAGSGDAAPTPVPASTPTASRQAPNPAAKVSRTATDPSLHPEGMELTEQLLYTGSGRNIFATSSAPVAPVAVIPKPVTSPRIEPVYTPPPRPGPRRPAAIDLKFFGTATRADGSRQAFFLKGEDVFLASTGDVVSRRYKVGVIGATSVQVTDLLNNNTQQLPLTSQ